MVDAPPSGVRVAPAGRVDPGCPAGGDVLVVRPVASPADRRARDGAARRRAGLSLRARERDGASDGARGEGVAVRARGRRGRGAQQGVRAGGLARKEVGPIAHRRGDLSIAPERSRRRRRRSSSCPARTSARPVSSSARSSGWRSAPRPACPCPERLGMGKGIIGREVRETSRILRVRSGGFGRLGARRDGVREGSPMMRHAQPTSRWSRAVGAR